ncbi:uncharacterized protein LOC123873504 [Maniola jurtina]|uniref:uncharacterized protein LOC123873504 n=1 Tax=Maniola jurtina TaxID=191418 RepID=UPI001E689017|nr:uncharacterized protein LOC123873504 [Maniola jurtina]
MKRARESDGSEGEGKAEAKAEVGRMVDSSQADDRRLIRLVRARRLLYARNNMPVASYYTQVKNLWDDVAMHMGWSVADVRRKWSHIRNSYSRHLRNEMHGACTTRGRMVSRWYLADELEFLREHMATDMRPTSYSSLAPTMVEMDMTEPMAEAVDVKPFLQSPWFALSAPPSPAREPRPSPLLDDSCSSTAFAPDENTSFFQFFRGIHNDFLELPARKQRLFKRKCLGLLHELLDEEERAADGPQHGVLNLSNSCHASDDERDHKPNVDDCYILPNTNT